MAAARTDGIDYSGALKARAGLERQSTERRQRGRKATQDMYVILYARAAYEYIFLCNFN